jgi:Tat protein secretion system quality control protein TatD with DNase activity
MKFLHQYDKNSPLIEVTLHSDSGIEEVIESFKQFLIAVGFHPNTVKEAFGDEEDE